MRSFTKFGISAIALMLLFSAFAPVDTKAQTVGPLNDVLKRLENHRNSLTSLKANVKMVKYNPQLDEREVQEGSASYVPKKGRDALIRIDWTKPNEEILSVVNKKYVIYTKRLKQAITGNASSAKGSGKANNLFAFINMSKDELKSNYEITYVGEEKVTGGTPTWHLVLNPKTASQFSSADLWVDGNGMPIQVKITEKNKDTVTVLLSGLVKNKTIKAKFFEVQLPSDTKIIDG